MKKSLLILSHQRSGTHLTIDLIRNNFLNYSQPYISFNNFLEPHDSKFDEKIQSRLDNQTQVFKSHADINYKSYYRNSDFAVELFSNLLESSSIIYVYRDPKDVLTSLFYHYKITSPLDDLSNLDSFVLGQSKYQPEAPERFLNRIEYWGYHINGWHKLSHNHKICFLPYELIISDYVKALGLLAHFLHEPLPEKIIDIRSTNFNPPEVISRKMVPGQITHTSVNFRNGGIGDHTNHMKQETIDLINTTCKSIINLLK